LWARHVAAKTDLSYKSKQMEYRFGKFTLDTRTGSVTGPAGPVALRRQTFRLLEVLLSHAPELLDRDTLLDEAWGRTALSANVLPQAISELRQALGDSAQSPRYIETLHRRGYRIVCDVEIVEEACALPHDISGSEPGTAAPDRYTSLNGNATSIPWLGLIASMVVLLIVSILWWNEASDRRWIHGQVVPEIRELMELDLVSAWRRTYEARQTARSDPVLEQLWLDLTLPTDLTSEPEGALIEVKGYRELDREWIALGTTPLEGVRLPIAQLRFRVSKPGHATLESAASILPRAQPFILHTGEEARAGMVHVPAGPVTYLQETRQLPAFWIDRLEVTNAEYRQFVDDGGYRRPEFWHHAATEDDHELTWDELMARLVDTTGMPGPSTWSMGTYPEGQDDHPVEGVSWYEAAAYAEYRGKQLPSVFHWYRAAGLGTRQQQQFADILLVSNFNGRGTTPVGSRPGLGHNGTLDMAGNVAEWSQNADNDMRHILGGSWMETQYRFQDPEAWPPLQRRAGFGIRLMEKDQAPQADLYANITTPSRTFDEPVDDATFAIYARQFDYDKLPLDSIVEHIDDSHRDWRREWVSFNAAYPGDRVIAQIFLPRNVEPPYQTVFYYPAGYAALLDSSQQVGLHHIEFLLRSGRAVVYPVFLGTFERKQPPPGGPVSNRDLLIHQVKDLRRTIDYVETRGDLDTERMMLYGISYGGIRVPYALAVESRFKAAIAVSAGMIPTHRFPPEMHMQNYLPRITIPFLLVNGRHDFNFPPETSQSPFFELLGTPQDKKRHVVLETGHIPPHFSDVIRACLAWVDRWLGPVDDNLPRT
jgi:formylglycine-generating enzyme required for sulfatase activity/DNA-binding winged helix-turn-helix (wHTH) protein/pimeloyl-ACP methyl ester carboxylesterase